MKKLYNNENPGNNNLLNDLKNLPKINAPENFEFKLMTKIQNRNFGVIEEEKLKFNLIKFFAPSAAVVAVIILFFVFFPQGDQLQKQIVTQNSIGDTQSIVTNSMNQKVESVQKNEMRAKGSTVNPIAKTPAIGSGQNSIQSNKFPFPLSAQRSVAVDDYISGDKTNANNLHGNIVNSGDQPIRDGFLIEKKTDKKTLEKYRDSLSRAQQLSDSLKKAQK